MGLTDGLTLILFSGSAIALTLFTVIKWQRIYRKTLINLLLRLLIIVLCQLLALVSIGLQVNRANGFFESWSDLFGSGSNYTQSAVSTHSLSLLSSASLVKAQDLPFKSKLVKDVITGNDSKVSNIVYLDLPRAAVNDLKRNSPLNSGRYRVIEFLTGFPSQPIMWVKVLKIDHELALYNETHVGHELIGIFPQINVAGKYDLECMNLPGAEPAAETWLSSDMHSYLDARLGIKESRWGIMGVSTGGWCATMLSMRHPDLYSAAVSIAGYYRPALPLTDPIKLQLAMDKKYDLTRPEAALKKTLPIYITASVGDKYSIRETRKFLAKPHPNLGITYKELRSGGHNSRVWVSLIPDAVDWLQRNIAV
jgi:pimeloyl-ACP methyl ester carboxylesterase